LHLVDVFDQERDYFHKAPRQAETRANPLVLGMSANRWQGVNLASYARLAVLVWSRSSGRMLVTGSFFHKAEVPTRYDGSEADGGAEMTFERHHDPLSIRVGDQRFGIPEAVMLGG